MLLHSASFKLAFTLVIGLLLVGCSGASWQSVEVESPYQAPKALKIAVVARANAKSAADALTAELMSGLESYGIKANLVSDAGGSPDVTVSIIKWDPGSRGTRWLTSGAAGNGDVLVTVQSVAVDGTAEGWVRTGFLGGAGENSAEAAGSLIAKTIATGKAETDQPKPNATSNAKVGHADD
jgi:hypothetical protein